MFVLEKADLMADAHVIKPPSTAEEDVKKKADQEGTRYGKATSEVTKCNVRFFAQKDVEATIEWANRRIAEIGSEIQKLEVSIMMQIDMGSQPTRGQVEREEFLQRQQDAIHVHPTRTRNDANKNWSIRAITATKQSLDRAFVEVDASDETTYDNEDRNKLPLATSPGLYRNNASSYGHDLPEYYADETDHEIKGFSEIKKGHWCFKVGRTTDTTTGICHGTEVYCNIIGLGQRTRYDEASVQSTLQKPLKNVEDKDTQFFLFRMELLKMEKASAWRRRQVVREVTHGAVREAVGEDLDG